MFLAFVYSILFSKDQSFWMYCDFGKLHKIDYYYFCASITHNNEYDIYECVRITSKTFTYFVSQ